MSRYWLRWLGVPAVALCFVMVSLGAPKGNRVPKPEKPVKGSVPAGDTAGSESPLKSDVPSKQTAFIRVWKGRTTDGNIDVQIQPKAGKDGISMQLATDDVRLLDYIELKPGTYRIVVTEGPEKRIVESREVAMTGGAFATMIIRQRQGKSLAEWIEDDEAMDALKNGVGEVVVRTLLDGDAKVTVNAGEAFQGSFRSADGFLHIRGLEPKTLQISTSVLLPDGTTENWNNEINFRKMPRATLIIAPDSYGRMRSRVMAIGGGPGGNTEEDEQKPAVNGEQSEVTSPDSGEVKKDS